MSINTSINIGLIFWIHWEGFTKGLMYPSGWWFGCHQFDFPIQLGISSSQLTFIFFRGVAQPPTSHCNDSHYGIDDQWPHVAFFNHGTPRNMIGPHIPRKEEQFHAWGFVIFGRMVTSIIWPTDRIWPKRHVFFFRNKIGIATAKELDDAGFDQQK